MNTALWGFSKNPHIYISFIVTCILLITAFFIGLLQFKGMENKLVLHTDVSGSIDLTGARKEIFFIMAVIGIICLLNIFLAKKLYARERMLSYMFSYANIWLGILMLIFTVSVVGMN